MFIVIFICTHNMFMPILCECDRACLLYRCMSADSGQPEYRVLLLLSRMNARQNGRWNLQLNEVGHQKSCLVYLHLKQEECHHWVVDIQSQRCHRNHNACGWCDNLLLYLLQLLLLCIVLIALSFIAIAIAITIASSQSTRIYSAQWKVMTTRCPFHFNWMIFFFSAIPWNAIKIYKTKGKSVSSNGHTPTAHNFLSNCIR